MIKKSIMAVLGAFLFTVVGFSGASACWPAKQELTLPQYALDIAKAFCVHEAHNPKVAFASQLRYEEMAEMIEKGCVTYEKSFDPKIWLDHQLVWYLYLDGVKLNKKLQKVAAAKAWKIKQIQKAARANLNKETT
jgi:hypothetical protein